MNTRSRLGTKRTPAAAMLARSARTFTWLACLCAGTAVAEGTWERLETAGTSPSERSAPAVAAIGESIYLFSGVKDDFSAFQNTFYNDLHRFDTVTDTWTQVATTGATPPARAFAASAAHTDTGRMLVFGGADYDPTFATFTVYGDFWAFSPATGQWEELVSEGPAPAGRSGANLWIQGDRAYLFGGITQYFQVLNDLWIYDFNTGEWTEAIAADAPGTPPGRHVAQAGSKLEHGRLTIYGGEALDYSTFEFVLLNDTWQLDLEHLTWTDVTPSRGNITPARNYAADAVIGERLYLQGGDIPGGEAGCGAPFPQNATHEVWSFHLVQKRWSRVDLAGDPPPRLKRTDAARVEDRMYVFSGYDFQCEGGQGPGQVWNRDVFMFQKD